MSIGSASLERFLENYFGSVIKREFGDVGLRVLADIIRGVRTIFQYIEPEVCDFPIIVFKTLAENSEPILTPQPYILDDYQQLVQIIDKECIIRLAANGQIHIWKPHTIDLSSLSKFAVVYQYHNRLERFF